MAVTKPDTAEEVGGAIIYYILFLILKTVKGSKKK